MSIIIIVFTHNTDLLLFNSAIKRGKRERERREKGRGGERRGEEEKEKGREE